MAKYIWFSGATDITGRVLAESLGLTATKTKPRALTANDIVIGWGTKTNENVNTSSAKVLNHPNAIRKNRDKMEALKMMAGVRDLQGSIARFCGANEIISQLEQEVFELPVIGRTNFHQGGKGLWLCLTNSHVRAAINDGAGYFQAYIDIATEYRIHVAFDNIIYAVKKVENPSIESWKAPRRDKIRDYAEKNNWNVDNTTMEHVLDIIFKETLLPDRIVRSNRRGWKFTSVSLGTLPQALKNVAIKSVKAIGLNFGAVDCAVDEGNNPFIIEVNSGPGLQGTALERYVEAFRSKINELENPQENRRAPARRAAVGADNANNAAPERQVDHVAEANAAVNEEALVHLMNAVRNPEEARRVLDLMNRGR